MKVLHVVGGELTGGAAKGAYNLHCGLKDIGVDSKILTNSNETFGDSDIISVSNSKIGKAVTYFRKKLDFYSPCIYLKRSPREFSTGIWGIDLKKQVCYHNADVIHLHWINGGFINIRDLKKISKPLVWSMRDMWPITGGCHYAINCERYKVGCGKCPQLKSRLKHDLSWLIIRRKIKYLPIDIKLVGVSRWLSSVAADSYVFRNYDVTTINNSVNCKEFFPVDKKTARSVLGIGTEKKILLAGATDLKSLYKGFDKYIESLKYLDKKEYLLLFFGEVDNKLIVDLGYEYKCFGYVKDTITLRLIYSAADLFVGPSIMDALPKTLVEAMACGTPVVCFDATGPKDIVDHKICGYKAVPFEPIDLAKGIKWVSDNRDYEVLCKKAIEKTQKSFENKIAASQYAELYKNIVRKDC